MMQARVEGVVVGGAKLLITRSLCRVVALSGGARNNTLGRKLPERLTASGRLSGRRCRALLQCVTDERLMGAFAVRGCAKALGWAIAALITSLNVVLVVLNFTGAGHTTP